MTRQLNKKDLDLRTLSFRCCLSPGLYGSEVLFDHPKEAINGELVNISRLVKPSYYEQVFSNLKAAHGDDHAKGCAFEKKVASVHNYLPQRVCKMFTKTCP